MLQQTSEKKRHTYIVQRRPREQVLIGDLPIVVCEISDGQVTLEINGSKVTTYSPRPGRACLWIETNEPVFRVDGEAKTELPVPT